jgi:hypothetical protein
MIITKLRVQKFSPAPFWVVQWLTRGPDDIAPAIVNDGRLADTFYVISGAETLISALAEHPDPSLPIMERRLDSFPTLIQRNGAPWAVHSTSTFIAMNMCLAFPKR